MWRRPLLDLHLKGKMGMLRLMGTVALEFQAIGVNVLRSHRELCAEDCVVDNLAPPKGKVLFC